jgi:hypothetical protein
MLKECVELDKRNPLVPLYAGVIMMLVGLQRILVNSDYVLGTISLALGVAMTIQFCWRQRKRPGA